MVIIQDDKIRGFNCRESFSRRFLDTLNTESKFCKKFFEECLGEMLSKVTFHDNLVIVLKDDKYFKIDLKELKLIELPRECILANIDDLEKNEFFVKAREDWLKNDLFGIDMCYDMYVSNSCVYSCYTENQDVKKAFNESLSYYFVDDEIRNIYEQIMMIQRDVLRFLEEDGIYIYEYKTGRILKEEVFNKDYIKGILREHLKGFTKQLEKLTTVVYNLLNYRICDMEYEVKVVGDKMYRTELIHGIECKFVSNLFPVKWQMTDESIKIFYDIVEMDFLTELVKRTNLEMLNNDIWGEEYSVINVDFEAQTFNVALNSAVVFNGLKNSVDGRVKLIYFKYFVNGKLSYFYDELKFEEDGSCDLSRLKKYGFKYMVIPYAIK